MAENPKYDLQLAAVLMEKAGTGGAIFRKLYRDFLKESYEITKNKTLKEGHESFKVIAKKWGQVSKLIYEAGESLNPESLVKASKICFELAILEEETMKKLKKVR